MNQTHTYNFLTKSVSSLSGVGDKTKKLLKRKKIEKVSDLLLNLPQGYTDRSNLQTLDKLEIGKVTTIKVKPTKYNFPRIRNLPNKVICEDEKGKIDIVFFNSREGYIRKILPINSLVIISGKINYFKKKYQITKYAEIIKNPKDVRYILEKAYYLATTGRPGPVWIDIPLDVQKYTIHPKKLKGYKVKNFKVGDYKINKNIKEIIKLLKRSSKPIIVAGNGVKITNSKNKLRKIIKKTKIPLISTRFAQDLFSHEDKYNLGQGGIKGSRYCKKIMNSADVVLSFGSRLSPQFVGHDFTAFSKAKLVAIDIERDELKKKGQKIYLPINCDLSIFFTKFLNAIKKNNFPSYKKWLSYCGQLKKENPIIKVKKQKNPIDLYYFMQKLGELSKEKDILVTDAGSNYYVGGQVWRFNKGQREITSGTNAAMGLTVPLAIGAAVASPNSQILAVTGDGSLELNIQELKTISHNNFNIKLFVINNGGYVSMHNWADSFFKGRRLDTSEDTGIGTLNFKNIAKAFDLEHYLIKDVHSIDKNLRNILKRKKAMFVEVITDPHQKIFDAFKDH